MTVEADRRRLQYSSQGKMLGRGTSITCGQCGKKWELTEDGFLKAADGEDIFTHIPDWYAYERRSVRKELEDGTYRLDIPILIRMLVDTKCLYTVERGGSFIQQRALP